mgnify:CR=1 FL=1
MSVIALSLVKKDLRVVHTDDDELLQTLLDAAEDEALRFMNLTTLPASPSITSAVFLLVRSKYDAEDADAIARLRDCVETLLMPYRIDLGM